MKFKTILVFAMMLLLLVGCHPDNSTDIGDSDDTYTPPALDTEATYYADIDIADYGVIIIQLDQAVAPVTCANFVELAESGFYDGLTFHRIIAGFMMQGGDPAGNGTGGSDNNIVGEFESNGHKNDLKHVLGVISMARTNDPNSGSSQFFLCVDNCHHLDKNYAGFGKMTDEESIKVLKELNSYPTGMIDYSLQDWPNTDIKNYTIKSIYRA